MCQDAEIKELMEEYDLDEDDAERLRDLMEDYEDSDDDTSGKEA